MPKDVRSPPKRPDNPPTLGLALLWARLLRPLARVAMLLVVCALACGGEEAPVDLGGRDVPTFEDGQVRFSERFAERIGLKTETAAEHELSPTLHVTGILEFDQKRLAAVGSRIAGRVTDVHVVEGAVVEPGDILATLESAELGSAQAEILAVRARALAAEANEDRKKQLVKEGIASKRSAEVAAREADVADAELMAARQRVQALLGADLEAAKKAKGRGKLGHLPLRAPIGGSVVGVNVFRGQAVEPSFTAFHIADPSQLWVRLAVFERELTHVREGDKVEILSQADADLSLDGVVAYVSPILDPTTLSAEVRVIVPNPEGKLRAGQAVTARILTSANQKRALSVPIESIVQVDGKPTVFVEIGERAVIPRAVTLGLMGTKRVEILEGLEPGEKVVTSGVFALKSELFR
ncbi:MAG: efflux RND transporter periplasmic adaptor subunit [Myxococcales bacterium]|nr:efflux RND transporter periplasmic adaptor subunit [Myxococcales bacterium]